jgi:DNA-binding transcriptional regulator GbsR (MarR family)
MPTPPLSPVAKKFILHWGEMGTRWGINRTVAQVHALLYISPKPLNAEEIAGALSVARSNVSTSLKELLGWGIVRTVHVLGDRRDHFDSMKDVWEMFRIVLDERKKREIDPTLNLLRECVAEAEHGGAAERHARQRLEQMLEFFQMMTTWYEQIRRLPMPGIIRFVKLGDKVRKWLNLGAAS